MNPYVKQTIENQIGIIEFYHPKSNSCTSNQLKKLTLAIQDFGLNDAVKVIQLKSYGEKIFCAGASFDELLSIDNLEVGQEFFMGFANVILAIKNCPKFVIGCIEGKVVGGGVGLAAACDYSFATENASIRLSELSIGIGPFVIEPTITKKIGVTAFSELTLNPKEWKTADWCKEQLFYHRVVENKEFEQTILDFSQQLSSYSPEAMKKLKSIFCENTQHWETLLQKRAKMSAELLLQDFAQETLGKFRN